MAVKTITIGELKAELKRLWTVLPEGEPFEGQDDLHDDYMKLCELRDLESTLEWCWHDDSTSLIRSMDFTEFAMDLLYETGDLRKGGIADGIIDCDKAAECIEQDYMLVTYDQEDYWVRN